mmetsp:Transcript_15850/g.27033  ORF Transcript_15850/g.27033 Transcript_15850/m.27033 type:complete len:386 (-) Transcript_15850:215-1372(-)|eukprot:CAMPEP_0183709742 /NCGR_PEP_ID=MMETSP0737-20130205/5724_1 /TAXON_ID=385413 /ORGANISM="Thalassiosira miniscula, Strain CCMP1093" /LENGTH=385 /DNA_ID=CAMNT_0025937919 /DNA_START=124 /DNA_END=1281 /DNA_ORIENTATION=-
MSTAEGHVGAALGLVFGAGAATAIGAAVVFFPSLVKLASRRVLAASLGLSAGVMTYVSFVEIFAKSVDGFAQAGIDPDLGYIYATLSFFGGVVTMILLDVCVKFLSGEHHHHHDDIKKNPNENEPGVEKSDDDQSCVAPHCVGCSDDPVGELHEWQQRAEEEIEGRRDTNTKTSATIGSNEIGTNNDGDNSERISEGDNSNDSFKDNQNQELEQGNKVVVENAPKPKDADHEQKKLVKMGLSTALAIALHNFPEGLATFVAALDDPSVGAVLAIAIGIHNIPEGLCVALPIYYATGNRWKAFMWGCLSGASEPIAALLGWAILANAMSDNVYAILFGLVSGMMVIISLKELIPTAHRYDPEDTVVTYSVIVGMVIIALSLVLFKL